MHIESMDLVAALMRGDAKDVIYGHICVPSPAETEHIA